MRFRDSSLAWCDLTPSLRVSLTLESPGVLLGSRWRGLGVASRGSWRCLPLSRYFGWPVKSCCGASSSAGGMYLVEREAAVDEDWTDERKVMDRLGGSVPRLKKVGLAWHVGHVHLPARRGTARSAQGTARQKNNGPRGIALSGGSRHLRSQPRSHESQNRKVSSWRSAESGARRTNL